VNAAAVAYARDRAGELVSLDGDQSLIASTREMIRSSSPAGSRPRISGATRSRTHQNAAAFSEARAELIADTEIAMANGAAKGEAWARGRAEDGALMVKEWFVSGEEGVCARSCEGNEAQGEIAFEESIPIR
jgi:hypothetical protein